MTDTNYLYEYFLKNSPAADDPADEDTEKDSENQ